jgi:hypothetical protein
MITVLLAAAVAVITGILSNEVFAWLPALALRLVTIAAARFRDPVLGARFREEWESAIAEIPGGLSAVMHAVSICFCVRNVERSCAAEIATSDLEERFGELHQSIRDFSDNFKNALALNGISLDDISRVTKVSIHDLRALMRGDLNEISIGYRAIFAYMPDLSKMLGSHFRGITAQYAELLRQFGGLPPTPEATRTQKIKRCWCAAFGHRALNQYVHSETKFPFHWCYRRCSRCGDVSIMRAVPCHGTRVRAKLDIDAPVVERFSCETNEPWEYWSLEWSDFQAVAKDTVDMTADRIRRMRKTTLDPS